jgi:hypothetical protein
MGKKDKVPGDELDKIVDKGLELIGKKEPSPVKEEKKRKLFQGLIRHVTGALRALEDYYTSTPPKAPK